MTEAEKRIRITSDSTCDLSKSLLTSQGIAVIPLYVVKDGVSYADGIQITPDEIFDHVKAGGHTLYHRRSQCCRLHRLFYQNQRIL